MQNPTPWIELFFKSFGYGLGIWGVAWMAVKISQEHYKDKASERKEAKEALENAEGIQELKKKVTKAHEEINSIRDQIKKELGDKAQAYEGKITRLHERVDNIYQDFTRFTTKIIEIIQE